MAKDNDDEYQAMDPRDKVPKRGFALRLAMGETVHLKYPDIHLKRVAPDQTAMAIFAYSLNIVLYGRRLEAVAEAMDGEFIPWVQEYDPKRWPMPADPQAVIVERVELYLKKGDDGEAQDKAQGPGGKPVTVRH